MDNIDTPLQVYSAKVIEELAPQVAALDAFSTDLSPEFFSEKYGQIRVPVVGASIAEDFDAETNNYVRTTAVLKDVQVNVDKQAIAGFKITADQAMNFRPAWWEKRGTADASAVALKVLASVFGLVTPENFGDGAKDKISVVLADFSPDVVALIRAAAVKRGINPAIATLVLNPDFYSKLLPKLPANYLGRDEAVALGTIRNLFGFRRIVEAATYSGPGFVNRRMRSVWQAARSYRWTKPRLAASIPSRRRTVG